MNLRKYFTLIKAGILDFLQFRLGTFVIIVGNMIYLIVIYNLWKAIYASVDTPTVNGMTFEETMIYLVLASSMFSFMECFLVWEMGRSIQDGNITLALLKPMGYAKYQYFSLAGNLVASFFLTFIPTFIVIEIITNGAIRPGINLLFFLFSVILGTTINFAVDFFVGTICIYTESIWGINIMKEVIVMFLSGATVPLAFFPKTLRSIVDFLPFQAIYHTPLTILTDSTLTIPAMLSMLGMQCIWVVVTLLIGNLFWHFSIRAITVNGG